MTKSDELKPCPFCGDEATTDKYEGEWYLSHKPKKGKCCPADDGHKTKAKATAAWNTRHSPVTPEEAREALNYLEGSKELGDIRDFLPEPIEETIRKALKELI